MKFGPKNFGLELLVYLQYLEHHLCKIIFTGKKWYVMYLCILCLIACNKKKLNVVQIIHFIFINFIKNKFSIQYRQSHAQSQLHKQLFLSTIGTTIAQVSPPLGIYYKKSRLRYYSKCVTINFITANKCFNGHKII